MTNEEKEFMLKSLSYAFDIEGQRCFVESKISEKKLEKICDNLTDLQKELKKYWRTLDYKEFDNRIAKREFILEKGKELERLTNLCIELTNQGLKIREIAKRCNIDKNKVRRIINRGAI